MKRSHKNKEKFPSNCQSNRHKSYNKDSFNVNITNSDTNSILTIQAHVTRGVKLAH